MGTHFMPGNQVRTITRHINRVSDAHANSSYTNSYATRVQVESAAGPCSLFQRKMTKEDGSEATAVAALQSVVGQAGSRGGVAQVPPTGRK